MAFLFWLTEYFSCGVSIPIHCCQEVTPFFTYMIRFPLFLSFLKIRCRMCLAKWYWPFGHHSPELLTIFLVVRGLTADACFLLPIVLPLFLLRCTIGRLKGSQLPLLANVTPLLMVVPITKCNFSISWPW